MQMAQAWRKVNERESEWDPYARGKSIKGMVRVLAGLAAFAVILGGKYLRATEEETMGMQSTKTEEAKALRLFKPEGLAKPAAGYTQVAEVSEGIIVYIAGQVSLDKA